MKRTPILTVSIGVIAWVIWWGTRSTDRSAPIVSAAETAVTQPPAHQDDAQADPDDSATPGQRYLQLVRQTLIESQPFRAKVLETVVIGARKFQVTGTYVQGRDLRLSLRYQLDVGKTQGVIHEVCDGQVLSTELRIGEDIRVTRRDVRQILEAAVAHGSTPQNMLIAELGLGGLSGLIASLERSMDFGPVQEEEVDGQRFTVVAGKWKHEFLDRWKGEATAATQIPAYVPDRVRVYCDAARFPRRFLYLKQSADDTASRPMVTLDLNDVVLKTSVQDEDFHFVPPEGVMPKDVTNQYIDQLVLPAAKTNRAETEPGTGDSTRGELQRRNQPGSAQSDAAKP